MHRLRLRMFLMVYVVVAAAAGTASGLGLAIVRQLVEAHGGLVRVSSEPGRGATFALTLPMAAG